MAICGVDGCEKAQNDRGICAHHLYLIGQRVEGDQVTWKQYEDAGICIPKKPTTKLCVTKGCGGKANARGLCNNCYAAALRIIEEKGIQWHDLEQVSASLPARRNRSKGPSLFRVNTERLLIKSEQVFIPPIEPAESDQPTVPVTQDQPLPPYEVSLDEVQPVKQMTLKGVPIKYVPNLSMEDQPIVPDVPDDRPEYQFDVPDGKSLSEFQPPKPIQSTPDTEPNQYQDLVEEKFLATEQVIRVPPDASQKAPIRTFSRDKMQGIVEDQPLPPFIPPIPASIKGETQEAIVIDEHAHLLTDADLGRLHIQESVPGPDDPTCSGINRPGGIQLPQVDLSHVNAPNPESVKEPATESPNFPAPPTYVPGLKE